MIDRDHKLPLARQAKAVGISRGSIYYRPRPVGEAGLGLMRRINELHLEYPFAGSRMMRGLLRQEGLSCGRRHIATLMRRMGIEALYRKPNTSRRRPGHTVYPYLLRGLEVSRPNQVWAMDITYIPMARGFVYLAAVMDWHSRKVLAWRVSVTMDTDFCVEALEESLGRHGAPEIFNTDQGSQFTSDAFTGLLKANGIQISMDGKGSWKDNVFAERQVYLYHRPDEFYLIKMFGDVDGEMMPIRFKTTAEGKTLCAWPDCVSSSARQYCEYIQRPWRECRLPEVEPAQTQGKRVAGDLDYSTE